VHCRPSRRSKGSPTLSPQHRKKTNASTGYRRRKTARTEKVKEAAGKRILGRNQKRGSARVPGVKADRHPTGRRGDPRRDRATTTIWGVARGHYPQTRQKKGGAELRPSPGGNVCAKTRRGSWLGVTRACVINANKKNRQQGGGEVLGESISSLMKKSGGSSARSVNSSLRGLQPNQS